MLRPGSIKSSAALLSGSLLWLGSFAYVLSAPAPMHGVQIHIVPLFHSAPIALDTMAMTDAAGQKLSVSRLDFLVSNFAVRQPSGKWVEQSDSVAYISARDGRTDVHLDAVPVGHYDRVRFLVGLKPENNHSDPANYPAGHPLNPTVNGLHWGWMGGYVFLALEGNWKQPDGQVGGYSYHLATDRELMEVDLPVNFTTPESTELRIALNLDQIFEGRNPIVLNGETTSTHSRTNDLLADQLRENIARAFTAEDSRLVADASLGISSEGGSGGIRGDTRARKASGIREGLGAEPPGSPSLENQVGPKATSVSTPGAAPSGGNALATEGSRLVEQTALRISSEGGSGSIRGGLGTRKALGIREGTGAELPGSSSLEIEIGPNTTPYPLSFAAYFPRPDLPRDNPLTVEGVELGRRLFFDARISVNNSQSCASCHAPGEAFTDGRATAVGAEGKPGTRNAMPLFNLAWKSTFFWDGRARSLREQVLEPIQNPNEMHESLGNVVAKLENDADYPALFAQAFGRPQAAAGARVGDPQQPGAHENFGENQTARSDEPATPPLPFRRGEGQRVRGPLDESSSPTLQRTNGPLIPAFSPSEGEKEIHGSRVAIRAADRRPAVRAITPGRIARALEQFLLTQVACDSKFDQVLRGEAKFTDAEQRGFELFHTEYDPRHEQFGADCFHCHGGPLFQSQNFANNGLDTEFGDSGRKLVTGREGDKGRFAVPSLRNIEVTGPYMHDGRFKTLEEVVEHYCTGIKRSATLDPNLAKHPDGGVPLNASDKKALVAFLKTLTDQKYRRAAIELASDNHMRKQ